MKKINFGYAGGFPLQTDTLDFMQNAYQEAFAGLAQAFGDKVILSGCVITDNAISDGIISYYGEIIPFKGGTYTNNAGYLFSDTSDIGTFQDGSSHPVYITKSCRADVSTTTNNFKNEFVRLDLPLLLSRVNTLWNVYNNTSPSTPVLGLVVKSAV